MLDKIKLEIDKHDVISFDIFDTSILRPYVKPSDVFAHIERLLNLKRFSQKRSNAEKKARKLTARDEITYKEIYDNIPEKYKKAYQFEIDFEKQICQRNHEIYEAYQYALAAGKIIIFVSDMYLPENVLVEILNKTGYKNYDHIFISSEYGKNKSSGKLFDLLIDILKIKPEKILHIGDHIRNDIIIARSKGLNAFFYPKVIDRFLTVHPNLQVLLEKNTDKRFKRDDLTISLIIGINSIIWSEHKNYNYWERLGSLYAGPLLYFYTNWVYQNAVSKGIKNIGFAARDGFNLIKIFKLFDRQNHFNAKYIFLPRFISESCNINSIEDFDLLFRGIGKSYKVIYNFIEVFSNDNSLINEKWKAFLRDQPSPSYDDLKLFLISNKEIVFETSKIKRDEVYQYLKSINLLDNDLMFVDSTCYKARAQKLLQKIITDNQLPITLYGYYYTVKRSHKYLNQTDIGPKSDIKYQTDKWDLIEFFMSSPESPIVSIKNHNNGYEPVYEDIDNNKYEKIRVKASKSLTKGIMAFSEKANNIFGINPIFKDLDTLVVYVNNLINNPSNKDLSHIKNLFHSRNNDDNYIPLLLPKFNVYGNYRSIYGQRVEVKRLSPESEHFFLGDSKYQAINHNGKEYLALNVPFMDRLPSKMNKANIFIIKDNGSLLNIASINYWNFKNGAYQQFRPENKDELIYSYIDEIDNKGKSAVLNYIKNEKSFFPCPFLSISRDGKRALSMKLSDFTDYNSWLNSNQIKNYNDLNNDECGITLIDLESGKENLIFPFKKLMNHLGNKPDLKKHKIILHQIEFNEDSSRFSLDLSIIHTDSNSQAVTVTSDLKGENIRKVFESGILSYWKDNNDLVTSKHCELSKTPGNRFNLFLINDKNGSVKKIRKSSFSGNGHFNYSPDNRFILYDSDTSANFPYRKLKIFDSESHKSITLGYFHSDPYLYNEIPDCACDLSPRWSPCGNYIAFNSIHEGFRGIYLINASEAINEIEREIETISEEEIKAIIDSKPLVKKEHLFIKRLKRVKYNIKKILKSILFRGR